MKFFIPCTPPKTTSQTKRLVVVNGRPRFFKKSATQKAENVLAVLLAPHVPPEPLQGPLSLTVTYRWPWRAGDSKKLRAQGQAWHDRRPDGSNLIKGIEDLMTTMRFWTDDGQVAELRFRKQVGDNAGIEIEINQLT